MRWGALVFLGLGACKGAQSKPPCDEPLRVQALLQTSDRANVGTNGQSWPTKLVVYQLTGTSAIEQLDPDALKEQGDALFGEELLDKAELTAFPATQVRRELVLKPKVSHLLVVADFRETLGTAWYLTYTAPKGLRDAQCSAIAQDEPPPIPCVYVSIDGSELSGGNGSPAGFSLAEFDTVCSVIAPPPKKKTKKRRGEKPSMPDLDKQPPKAPDQDLSAPKAPSKPTAPSRPGR